MINYKYNTIFSLYKKSLRYSLRYSMQMQRCSKTSILNIKIIKKYSEHSHIIYIFVINSNIFKYYEFLRETYS